MNKAVKFCGLVFIGLLIVALLYFFVGNAPQQKNITWGVNFSQMQADSLKLDWKQTYLAIIEDLGAKNIKLITNWDYVEGKQDTFYFSDIDWQLAQAQAHQVHVIYVVGLKTGRWPECHAPGWASSLSQSQEQSELLDYIREVVERYKSNSAITTWQVENEPLFEFGQCPGWYYDSDSFLKQEVALVKSLDPTRPVIVSDSGEQSFWFDAASIGDIVGVTMYRTVWVHISNSLGFYTTYPIPPVFYYRKAQLLGYLFGKPVISVELQAEPWVSGSFSDTPLAEQEQTMNLGQFKSNVTYAKQTGLNTFYFWGAEWWYWLKTKENQPQIWNYAKEIIRQQ